MKTMKAITLVILSGILFFSASPIKSGYNIGDTASDFSLKNVDGKMVSLSDYKDAKGFIIIFDCNTCPYSKAYNTRIQALNKKYIGLDFPVIAINANDPEISKGDSFDEMVKESKRKNYGFPYLVDATQSVAKVFGATNTPHVFVLARQGNELKVAYTGTIDDNARDAAAVKKRYVEEAVDALLAGKSISTPKTRALGCGIKWKE